MHIYRLFSDDDIKLSCKYMLFFLSTFKIGKEIIKRTREKIVFDFCLQMF